MELVGNRFESVKAQLANAPEAIPAGVTAVDDIYSGPILFHCFWYGTINEKHLQSIRSCYFWNVKGRPNRCIVLWLQQALVSDQLRNEILKYAEIRDFAYDYEVLEGPTG